ncbi:hypothetical protein B0T09DRAFT_400147 [Sordaria sp. MPI-SDFR-AT-0083]|nr:hypothetical protein B0T09DRAFT_400147 [Sordaria sp. MPI-SDFR-AT-0083]
MGKPLPVDVVDGAGENEIGQDFLTDQKKKSCRGHSKPKSASSPRQGVLAQGGPIHFWEYDWLALFLALANIFCRQGVNQPLTATQEPLAGQCSAFNLLDFESSSRLRRFQDTSMAETATKQSDAKLVCRVTFGHTLCISPTQGNKWTINEAFHAAMVSRLSVARSPKNEGDNASSASFTVVVTLATDSSIAIHQHLLQQAMPLVYVPHSGPHLQACRPMQPWNGSCPCNPFSSAAGPEWRPMCGWAGWVVLG